ncbi:MAG: tRNA pseudouridine(38-40) synthase TruA, partial [Bacilli bacterium]|nr:tRNA pseudouridine(38-40) synthase TruA [Bacilli bacterium]
RLPDDIHVKTVYFAPVLFHSRFDVLAKEYRYTLNLGEYDPLRRNYEWTVDELDLGTLEKNLKQLLGSHDFTSFCTGDKEDRVRTIFKADYEIEDDKLQLVFIGDGFLHHMLRLIVFQLVLIASGKVDYDIESLINDMSRRRTTRLAPSGGLCLEKVIY